MSLLSSWFGTGRKPQTVSYEGIGNLGQIGVAQKEWLPELLKRVKTRPEDWAGKYYDYLYQPTAEQMRSEWGEQVEAPIMSTAGGMGMERASHTLGDIAKETARREMELGRYGGELRARGFETGLEQQAAGMAGLQDYVSLDAAIRQHAADQALRAGTLGEERLQDYATTQAYKLPQLLMAGGNIMSLGAGMGEEDWLQELLQRQRKQYVV